MTLTSSTNMYRTIVTDYEHALQFFGMHQLSVPETNRALFVSEVTEALNSLYCAREMKRLVRKYS